MRMLDVSNGFDMNVILLDSEFDSDFLSVRDAVISARDALTHRQIGCEHVTKIELAVAEALNNVVEHAYKETCNGMICMKVEQSGKSIIVSVMDHGLPFPSDKLSVNEPVHAGVALSDIPEGGFGWYFIRTIAENVNHRRSKDGINHLQMEFRV